MLGTLLRESWTAWGPCYSQPTRLLVYSSRVRHALGPALCYSSSASNANTPNTSTMAAKVETRPKPEEPDPSECCQNGCQNCVWDMYYDDLKEWTLEQETTAPGGAAHTDHTHNKVQSQAAGASTSQGAEPSPVAPSGAAEPGGSKPPQPPPSGAGGGGLATVGRDAFAELEARLASKGE